MQKQRESACERVHECPCQYFVEEKHILNIRWEFRSVSVVIGISHERFAVPPCTYYTQHMHEKPFAFSQHVRIYTYIYACVLIVWIKWTRNYKFNVVFHINFRHNFQLMDATWLFPIRFYPFDLLLQRILTSCACVCVEVCLRACSSANEYNLIVGAMNWNKIKWNECWVCRYQGSVRHMFWHVERYLAFWFLRKLINSLNFNDRFQPD